MKVYTTNEELIMEPSVKWAGYFIVAVKACGL